MTTKEKTRGQIAYEADVAAKPFYHDGVSPRVAWDQLPEVAQWSWERPKESAQTASQGGGA